MSSKHFFLRDQHSLLEEEQTKQAC